jgi:hypothetical protein
MPTSVRSVHVFSRVDVGSQNGSWTCAKGRSGRMCTRTVRPYSGPDHVTACWNRPISMASPYVYVLKFKLRFKQAQVEEKRACSRRVGASSAQWRLYGQVDGRTEARFSSNPRRDREKSSHQQFATTFTFEANSGATTLNSYRSATRPVWSATSTHSLDPKVVEVCQSRNRSMRIAVVWPATRRFERQPQSSNLPRQIDGF